MRKEYILHTKLSAINLKAVLKETGIGAHTLRAWERRYGLPMPERSPGGHRLYSPHDIEIIKWLMARREEGLSISHAVNSWKKQTASGMDPLTDSETKRSIPSTASSLETTRRDWLTACLQFHTLEAEQILNQAYAVHSVEIICMEIILQGLYEMGELWHKAKATVHQEHFASELAIRRLEALISSAPPPHHEESIVLACPPDEWHDFPLLLINLLLRRRGWNVIYLGANVPTDQIELAINSARPGLVILAGQTLVSAVRLREMARALNKLGIRVAFGGRVFTTNNELPQSIPAHFLGYTIEYAIPRIEKLIADPLHSVKEWSIAGRNLKAADAFRQNRFDIERAVRIKLEPSGCPVEFLDTANRFLGDSLSSALELGSVSLLSTEINWLYNLMLSYWISVSVLPFYLEKYAQAVREIIGADGVETSDWLILESARLNQ